VPRADWLITLPVYEVKSFNVDSIQVHVYGETAVVFMLFAQEATVRGHDRSAQFAITDIWVKEPAGG
jgi:ketosteroid isomerase-like protein